MREARYDYRPNYATPPGATLAETLECAGVSQDELAKRTGLSVARLRGLIAGDAPLTPEIAVLLEEATGTPARLWNRLEANYREAASRLRGEDST